MSTWLGLTLIDWLALLGIVAALPLALGGPWRWWALAGTSAFAAFHRPTGVGAALLVLPWLAVCLTRLGALLARTGRRGNLVAGVGEWVPVLAAGWAVVAAGSLLTSRAGVAPLGLHEPIIELTAIHYTYAGAAALVLAGQALRDAVAATPGFRHQVALAAVSLTGGAPPVVAVGFVTHRALPQVGGAVLMALGVCLTGLLELRAAFDRGRPAGARALLALSGAAIWIPMVLAVAWAAGQHWDVPALSIPDMARTHGATNAVAFVLGGLLGRLICERREALAMAGGAR